MNVGESSAPQSFQLENGCSPLGSRLLKAALRTRQTGSTLLTPNSFFRLLVSH